MSIKLGILASSIQSGGGTNPAATAFFNRVTAAGGTLTTNEQNAVNTLVNSLQSAGIWNLMKAIYPMVGASAASCSQNLVSSSFTGTFTTGWTFASTGAKGNGTSAYMNTNYNPITSSNVNSKHLAYYSRNNFIDCLIGANIALFDQIYYFAGAYYNILSTGLFVAISSATTKGFLLASRITGPGGTTTYVNNSNLGNDGLSAFANPGVNLYINARNANGTANGFSSNECAFASIGEGLNNTQASNFYASIQAFQTTLGRQV
jgi:hypothetical protein